MEIFDTPGLNLLGKLKNRRSTDMSGSRLGVGFECLDRDMWNPEQAWPVLADLGVKWARVQTGWARTERVKGEYDFAWLDDIVDKLRERGVQPWLSLSYGNPLYTPDMNTAVAGEPEARQDCNAAGVGFPPIHTPEARAGWKNYVCALVRHFRDRVTHYEVWNEPDLTSFWRSQPRAAEYVDLVRMTAEPLRKEQPGAQLLGGAIAWGMTVWSLKFLEDCFKAGLHELIDVVTYHGYKAVPERHSSQEIAAFTHLIERYKPGLAYWQGEAGVQSHVPEVARGKGALSTMRFSEAIQARMLLRRTLLELSHGCGMTSYFHMADFSHYVDDEETFHYGLVRLEDGSPKPSFFALQSLCTLLGGEMEPAGGRTAGHMSVKDDTDDPRATKIFTWHASFVRDGVPVHAYWLPDSVEDDPEWRAATMAFWMEAGLRLENPVLIDPVGQAVYALPHERDQRACGEDWMHADPEAEGIGFFPSLPVSSSPLLITDRSLVVLV